VGHGRGDAGRGVRAVSRAAVQHPRDSRQHPPLGTSAALSGEAFYKVFSQELFPTILRGTAQGITFGVARTLLGVWSLFVPMLAHAGIAQVAALLTLFLTISGAVGFFFMPDTSGKSLEQIESERTA
jgi:inositol transporter-like SP family MFS transporter